MLDANDTLPTLSARGAPDGPLLAGSTNALRSWLQAQRRAQTSGADVRSADLRRAMRLVCAEARRREVRIERVIVLLKELWSALPPDAADVTYGHAVRAANRDLLERIVRVCIEEFYLERGPAPMPGGATDSARPLTR